VASYSAVLPRLLLVAASIVLVVLLAGSRRHFDACETARTDVIGTAVGTRPSERRAPAIEEIREQCRGAQSLVSASAVLYREGDLQAAQALAQEAAELEPDNATAWNALAVTAAERDPATARRAAQRAVALSPLDPPPGGAGGP
jgi:tetratricopeptide (TPR) repeat protein